MRKCAKDHVVKFSEVRQIFREEVNRYNNRQVHSTTKEIPIMRLEAALNQNRTMFRPFSIPKPYASTKDIFCLRTTRTVNHYQKIALHNLMFDVPSARPGQEVAVKSVRSRKPDRLKFGFGTMTNWRRLRLFSCKIYPKSIFEL